MSTMETAACYQDTKLYADWLVERDEKALQPVGKNSSPNVVMTEEELAHVSTTTTLVFRGRRVIHQHRKHMIESHESLRLDCEIVDPMPTLRRNAEYWWNTSGRYWVYRSEAKSDGGVQ